MNLSQRVAARTIDVLKKTAFDSPLVAVELSFRTADRYVPLIIPFTQTDSVSSFPVVDAYTPSRLIELEATDFEPEMAEFLQRVRASEQYQAGTKMLQGAARLITMFKPPPFSAAEGFIAYAIDWELQADEFPTILRACGADPRSLSIWTKRGWLS